MSVLSNLFGKKKAAPATTGPPGVFGVAKTEYKSNHIDIPEDFLSGPPATPLSIRHVDFVGLKLPEYKGHVAFTIDNVLSQEECNQLLSLAESAVPLPPDSAESTSEQEGAEKHPAWQPAKVNMGMGFEAHVSGYRESDRIIWDRQEVVDLLWERLKYAEGLEEMLRVVELSKRNWRDRKIYKERWVYSRLNDRMRFLRYEPGQFFKPHCDGPYWYRETAEGDGTGEEKDIRFQTFYTIQLYLNDSAVYLDKSAKVAGGVEPLIGGATSFLSTDEKKRIDIDPKAGSVLIFQHEGLLHEGAEVEEGIKYTVRGDILYRLERDSEDDEAKEKS